MERQHELDKRSADWLFEPLVNGGLPYQLVPAASIHASTICESRGRLPL